MSCMVPKECAHIGETFHMTNHSKQTKFQVVMVETKTPVGVRLLQLQIRSVPVENSDI